MTREQVDALVKKYAEAENLTFPTNFEHRYDVVSSKILYSIIREHKPQTYLEFGTSWGGSALVAMKALVANELPYKYVGFEIGDDLRRETLRNLTHWFSEGRAQRINFEIWEDITKNIDKIPRKLDFAFIDPDWDEEIAKWTFKNIIPRVKKGGIVHIHDWSVSKDLEYQGGGFPGIFHFIELFKKGKMPLEKIFAVWDEEDYKAMSIAASFWRKV